MSKWPQRLTEKDATGPDGTKVSHTVDVNVGDVYPIALSEDTHYADGTPYDVSDQVLLDLPTARWMHAQLGVAISEVEKARLGASKAEKAPKRSSDEA